jgi:hypothetical protein
VHLASQSDPANLFWIDAAGLDDLADRFLRRAPPIGRFLLGPRRFGRSEGGVFDRGGGED